MRSIEIVNSIVNMVRFKKMLMMMTIFVKDVDALVRNQD